MKLLLRAAVVAGLAFAATFAIAQNPPPGLSDEDRADLAWFDSLGYPKVDGEKFVRVTGPYQLDKRGFVIEDDGVQCRFLGLDLIERTIDRSPPGTPDDQRIAVTPLRTSDAIRQFLGGGESPAGFSSSSGWGDPSSLAQNFVFAALRTRSGQDEMTHALLAHVRTLTESVWGYAPSPRPFRDRLAEDLATSALFGLKSHMAGKVYWPDTDRATRSEHLEFARQLVKRFPAAKATEEATEFVRILELMIREDEEHAKTARSLDQLEGDARVAELVFRLRDQRQSGIRTNGNRGDFTATPPASDLVAIGLSAVPRLAEALADGRFTRDGLGNSGAIWVDRVGDAALAILEKIAGHGFKLPVGVDEYDPVTQRQRTELYRNAVEGWYADVSKLGITSELVRSVEAGDGDSEQAARSLLARDPEKVPAALLNGLVAAKSAEVRRQLVELAASLPGDAVRPALREVARSTSDSFGTRFAALKALVERGEGLAVDVALAMWRERWDGGGPPTRTANPYSYWYRSDEFSMLADLLLSTKRADVVRALGEDMPRRTVDLRRRFVQALAGMRDRASAEFALAIDEVLASALDDRAEYPDVLDSRAKAEGFGWRVRDTAAAAMAKARGLVAPRLADPFQLRETAIGSVRSAWVREHGLAERAPVPALPAVPSVDAAEVQRRVDKFLATARGTDASRDALSAIESLGLAAVAEIDRIAQRSPRLELSALAGRLAFTVRAVRIEPEGAVIPEPLRAGLAGLVGKPLTAAAFDDVVWTMITTSGDALHGASLDVWRGTDGDGVVVTLSVQDGSGGGYALSSIALRGDHFLKETDVGGWSRELRTNDGRRRRMAEEALAAPPRERSWIHVLLVRRPP